MENSDSIWETRALILSQLDDTDAAEMRERWTRESLVKDPIRVEKISKGADMQSTGFIESRVACELLARAKARKDAAEEAERLVKLKVVEATGLLRKQLSEQFIRDVGVTVADAKATFWYRDLQMTVAHDKELGWTLNGTKVADAPGTLSDKIIETIIRSEDF